MLSMHCLIYILCTLQHCHIYIYRPLSRRLDRCDRVIQNESRDPFGGNVYYVTMQRSTHYHQMGLSPHSRLQWRFRDKGLYCCVWTSCSVLPRVAKGHFCSRNYILGALSRACSDDTLHKLWATHPMFKCVAIHVIRNRF